MKDWLDSLETRERVFVIVGAVVVVIAIVWSLVWLPLDKRQQRLEEASSPGSARWRSFVR